MFAAFARRVVGHPRAMLATTLVLVLLGGLFGADVADRMHGMGLTDPAAESSRATALLDREFPASRPDLALLVRAPAGVDNPAAIRGGDGGGRALTDRLSREPAVGARSYLEDAHARAAVQ
jgi:putative drug exporter of the RND superfamily